MNNKTNPEDLLNLTFLSKRTTNEMGDIKWTTF